MPAKSAALTLAAPSPWLILLARGLHFGSAERRSNMTSISSVSATAHAHSQGASAARGGAGFASSLSGAGASGDTTSVSTNADGSTTTTVTNAQGEIVSTSTTAPSNQATLAAQFAQQADKDELAKPQPASLLSTFA
jgi:hypothetical protein